MKCVKRDLIFHLRGFLIAFLLCIPMLLNSQELSGELAEHIAHKLNVIDSLLGEKKFQLALSKVDDLKSYSNFIKQKDNRLSINLIEAKALYGFDKPEESMELLLSGLNEFADFPDSPLRREYLSYLAKIFYRSKDYNRSQYYLNTLLLSSLKNNDTLNILDTYLYKGVISSRTGNVDSAITYYNKIIEFPVNPKTETTISKSYSNLSAMVAQNGNLEAAIEYGNKAIDIKMTIGDSIGAANALMNLSSVYYYQEDYEEARKNYLNAFNFVDKAVSETALRYKSGILLNLAYSNEMLGNYEAAYKHLEQATNLRDSLAEVNVAQNISEIEAKYNVEKQALQTEKERSKRLRAQALFYGTALAFLAILALGYIFYRNYRLKQQAKLDLIENESQTKIINATIDAKEMERKAIAETLHDSVSALLSSANLHLQATKAQLKKKSPQEITKAQTIVNEASVKIRDLSHELISSVLLKFGLAFAVHDMCQKYSNSELTLHSDDDGIKRYHQDFEIKIHNIIEELINNILKHSKASNATIMLAHKENDMLSVRISDDGIGFNPRQVRGKDGLGLSHIEARIKVMKGVFNIISSRNNGTNIFILVPIQFKEKTVSA